MDLYHNRDGSRKSSVLLTGFLLSLLFAAVYFCGYAVLTGWFFARVPSDSKILLMNIACIGLISLTGSLVCCLCFLLLPAAAVQSGFRYLAAYLVVCIGIVCIRENADQREMMLEMLGLYMLGPVLIGNCTAAIFSRVLKNRRRESERTAVSSRACRAREHTDSAGRITP